MSLSILNVGEGDTKISFDPKNPQELKRSKTIVQDLLKRGFALLVQVGEKNGEPLYQRVKRFDPQTCEYLVVGDPPVAERPSRGLRRMPAATTKAVAVARSAGG